MIRIKLNAASKYINKSESQAIEALQRLLSTEDGYLIPIMFVGQQAFNREIDALLLLPDAIFLLDFKNWDGQRIEVEGLDGEIRRLRNGAWEEEHNSLPNYEYAARELATRLKYESWLPSRPHIYSLMIFTAFGLSSIPQISFAGGDPKHPRLRGGVSACRIEQLPQLLATVRATTPAKVQLTHMQLANLAEIFVKKLKPAAKPRRRRIAGYLLMAEHHTDQFLDCKIYLGEGETLKEQVWVKEYAQILASQEQRTQREQLVLRHADILHRFPQQKNIVAYRAVHTTASHLYIILERRPGAFLRELLSREPEGQTTKEDLQSIPFDLTIRLHILGDLLSALDYLIRQPGFEQSAYRDLRPDSIFIQFANSVPTAQLFNFDCTKLPGAFTRLSHLRRGQQRSPSWDDYASPELLEYITSSESAANISTGFTGGIRSDLFSWGVIAWELLTGMLPFQDSEAKLAGHRQFWPGQLDPSMDMKDRVLPTATIRLIEACLELNSSNRPDLATLRHSFS